MKDLNKNIIRSTNSDSTWQTIVKEINLFKKSNVDIETRTPPNGLSTNALARNIYVYNKFENNREIANGIFLILYDKKIQTEWNGKIRIVTQSKSIIEPELANDPLLPNVSMEWFNNHFSKVKLINVKGVSTVLNSVKFSSKKTIHNLETRISWTIPNASNIHENLKNYINYLEQIGGQY